MNWKDTQSQLTKAILDESQQPPQGIIPGGKLATPQAVLRVHREGYVARLTESLGEIFETVWWVLGDQQFFEVCEKFILQNPSQTYNLSNYGEKFESFLAGLDLGIPFLSDIARFEWNFQKLFHCRLSPSIDLTEIEEKTQKDFSLTLGLQLHLFYSPYRVNAIWQMRKSHPEGAPDLEVNFPTHLLLFRNADDVLFEELTPLQFKTLQRLTDGELISKALEEVEEGQADQVQHLFQVLAGNGLIEKILPTQ